MGGKRRGAGTKYRPLCSVTVSRPQEQGVLGTWVQALMGTVGWKLEQAQLLFARVLVIGTPAVTIDTTSWVSVPSG